MNVNNTVPCLDCENQISKSSTKCPHCGSSEPHGGGGAFGCTSFFMAIATIGLIKNEDYIPAFFTGLFFAFMLYIWLEQKRKRDKRRDELIKRLNLSEDTFKR